MGLFDAFRPRPKPAELAPVVARSVRGFPLQVVGESRYLENFIDLFGERDADGIHQEAVASIEYEDGNRYDPMAVVVKINGLTIGYLNRLDAREYREAMIRCGCDGRRLTCAARIRGGWYRGSDDEGEFGVTLALDIAEPVCRDS